MDENPILVEPRDGYRVLTLNRPQRLNAFTEPMHVALREALAAAEADTGCRALLITGAGRGFCAGQDLALSCDIVIAARSASFIQSFARIGLVPDSGGTWTLPRLVGPARARALALLAEPLPAETAEAWGLIWKVYDDATLMEEAHKLCARFAVAPTAGLALIKRALDLSWDNDLDAQLDLEREFQREASLNPDYAEGVRAFMEKRPPRFGGRR